MERTAEYLLTPAELKARLKISTRTYSRLLASRALPFRLVGSLKRFCWSEVLAALPSGSANAATRPRDSRGSVDMTTYLKQRAARWGR